MGECRRNPGRNPVSSTVDGDGQMPRVQLLHAPNYAVVREGLAAAEVALIDYVRDQGTVGRHSGKAALARIHAAMREMGMEGQPDA